MLSIGQRLSRARTDRHLTIEDVVFYTHIPAGRVQDMENDDLSRFANMTYARGFLKIYSQFLELDISEYLDQFSTAEMAHASGHEYVQMANTTQNLPAAVITDYGQARQPGLYILLVFLIAGGGIFWWHSNSGPEDEDRTTNQNQEVTATESPAVPPASPTSQPVSVTAPSPAPKEVIPENTAAQNSVAMPDTAPEAIQPHAPDTVVKPPKATIIDEEAGIRSRRGSKPSRPD